MNEPLYNANEESLVIARANAKKLCMKYNCLDYDDTKNRYEIIKNLFKKTGDNFLIEPVFWCDYGYNIEIGENFYSNHNLVILDCAKIVFGDNVLIGPNCGFYAAGHPIDIETRNKGLEYAKEIIVGDNVWIGGNVTVVGGVKIGSGSVIGAGSVVTRDIPENSIAYGNPCKPRTK